MQYFDGTILSRAEKYARLPKKMKKRINAIDRDKLYPV